MWGIILTAILASSGSASANDSLIRWVGSDDPNSSILHIIDVINQKTGRKLTQYDFLLEENRDLAFNHYQRWVQVVDQVPIHGKSIRVWTDPRSRQVIQVEADLEKPRTVSLALSYLESSAKSAQDIRDELTSDQTVFLAQQSIEAFSDDPSMRGLDWKDEWKNGRLYRLVKARGKSGYHFVRINLTTKTVISHDYKEFPQYDGAVSPSSGDNDTDTAQELSLSAQVYPIYEEVEDSNTASPQILPRISTELKYIQSKIPQVNGDIYLPLRDRHYYDFTYDPSLGSTEAGRAKGYWSMAYIKEQASHIRSELPLINNNWSNGVVLQGKYATINIHPEGMKKFAPAGLNSRLSSALFPSWEAVVVDTKKAEEMIPTVAYYGKPLSSPQEAWNRPARRLSDHNPTQYLSDGFDEIQVYYAINTLFDALHERGFQDPDLSTRPFNAFLFNPDIVYRDNAFYTDDTINFTTYSPKADNAARNNSTIWHELGHGVMDRLMGDQIELADTGGLSEGMADFVAAMVIRAVTNGVPFPGSDKFRIMNHTGFNLTNEVHDDGEAYGGAMKDFMDAVIGQYGQKGLTKVADVVLEAMRLTRDFPGLTAPEWFQHLLFADSLGRPGVREPNELKSFLIAALAGRNFKMDGGPTATFTLWNATSNEEVVAGGRGSRISPILVRIPKTGTASFALQANVKNSDSFAFQFPVQIRVQYNGGPLQGAVHWVKEEQGTQIYTLNSEADAASIPLQVTGTCDEVNRTDGSCVDYVYVQVWNHGETQHPVAKKRFYLRVKNPGYTRPS